MAHGRQQEDDGSDKESRAGRNRNWPARLSTVNLMIQIVMLIRVVIDVLGH